MKHNLFTAIVLLCSTMVNAQDFEVNGIYYNIVDKKAKKVEVTIGEKAYAGDIIIPETVVYKKKEYTVTSLGRYKEEVRLDRTIDGHTFYIKEITTTDASDIGTPYAEVFECNQKITSITLPNSIEFISDGAFAFCKNLKTVKISKSIRNIAYNAFRGCLSLNSIIVDEDNTVYDSRTNCNAIILTDKNLLLAGSNNTIIPDGIKIIGAFAFSGRKELTKIKIPDSVEKIDALAFSHCIGLTSIEIPSSVTSIEGGAFEGCTRLTSIKFPETVNITVSMVEGCNNLKSIKIGNETFTKEEFMTRFSEPKVETTHSVVAEQPEFPGGMVALMNYLEKNIQYPKECKENNIQGKVYVNFVVNTDGTLDNIEISKSSGNEALDSEAVRLVKAMPNWIPGKQNDGKAARASFTLPVLFRL